MRQYCPVKYPVNLCRRSFILILSGYYPRVPDDAKLVRCSKRGKFKVAWLQVPVFTFLAFKANRHSITDLFSISAVLDQSNVTTAFAL